MYQVLLRTLEARLNALFLSERNKNRDVSQVRNSTNNRRAGVAMFYVDRHHKAISRFSEDVYRKTLKRESRKHNKILTLISGFRRDVDETCGLLTREDGTDTLPRNVGKQLSHDAA